MTIRKNIYKIAVSILTSLLMIPFIAGSVFHTI